MAHTSELEKTLDETIKTLAEFVKPDDLPPALPITHLTIARWFESIVENKTLEARYCNVFDRKIVYFFYGGVFYRSTNKSTQDKLELPIVFVFHPEILSRIDSYYPFDTGAMASGRFGEEWCKKFNNSKEKFKVRGDGDREIPKHLIYYIFGSNKSYLEGNINSECTTKPEPFPELYQFMSEDFCHLGADLRQYSVECQFINNVDLERDLEWVGIPENQFDVYLKLCRKLSPHRPKVFTYSCHKTFVPSEIGAILEKEAKEGFINRFII